MPNKIRLVFLILIKLLGRLLSFLTETQINFPTQQTSNFQGLFARKISKDIVYISNLQEEIQYDIISNKVLKQYTQLSTCFKGTVCPFLLSDFSYIISKNNRSES